MIQLFLAVVIFAAGFVAGALVFRNNQAKGEAVVKTAEKVAENAKEQVK